MKKAIIVFLMSIMCFGMFATGPRTDEITYLTQKSLKNYEKVNYAGNHYYELTEGNYSVTEDLFLDYPIQINAPYGSVKLYADLSVTIRCSLKFDNSFNNAMIIVPMGNSTLILGGGMSQLTIVGLNQKLMYVIMSSSNLVLQKNVTITQSKVQYGAIYIGAGTTLIDGGVIKNNISDYMCSGIFITGGTLKITSGTISNNHVSGVNEGASIHNIRDGYNVTVDLPGDVTVERGNVFKGNILDGVIHY